MNSPESGTPYKLFKPKIIISNEIFSYLHKSILSHKNRRKLNKCWKNIQFRSLHYVKQGHR